MLLALLPASLGTPLFAPTQSVTESETESNPSNSAEHETSVERVASLLKRPRQLVREFLVISVSLKPPGVPQSQRSRLSIAVDIPRGGELSLLNGCGAFLRC